MNPPETPEPTQAPPSAEAEQHVADAHHLLKTLRKKVGNHPELDEAILKIEMALYALTLKSGGNL